jgi:hypothetical protein
VDEDGSTQEPVSRIVAVIGGTRRREQWLLAAQTHVVSVLGHTMLDLRQVECHAATVEMTILSVLGGVTILVPDGTEVRLSGATYLGSSDSAVAHAGTAPGVPRLIVTATTVLGRVRVVSPTSLAQQPAGSRGRKGKKRSAATATSVASLSALFADDPADPEPEVEPLPPLARITPEIDWPEDEDDDEPPDVPLSQLMGASRSSGGDATQE